MKQIIITTALFCTLSICASGQTPKSQPDEQAQSDRRSAFGEYVYPRWYTSPEWWLVIVGIPTLIFVGIQALETKNAAEATLTNVRAIINAERAWLIVDILPVCKKVGNQWLRPAGSGWASLDMNELLQGHHLRHTIKLTNMGRTPAHILRFQLSYSHLPEGVTEWREESLSELIEAREFGHALAASDSIEIQEPIIDVFNNRGSSAEQIRAVDNLKATLVVHGWVEYQHVFDTKSAERVDFLYSYSPVTKRLNKVARPKRLCLS